MPTTRARTNITHVPQVQRILDEGRKLWPSKSDKDVIIDLAERGLRTANTRGVAGLTVYPGGPGPLTVDMVEDALLND